MNLELKDPKESDHETEFLGYRVESVVVYTYVMYRILYPLFDVFGKFYSRYLSWIPYSWDPYHLRLGPSASEAMRPDDNTLDGLVKSLTHIKKLLGVPKRDAVGGIAHQLLSVFPMENNDLENAEKGMPAPSVPGSKTTVPYVAPVRATTPAVKKTE